MMEAYINSFFLFLTSLFDLYIIYRFMTIFFQKVNVNHTLLVSVYLLRILLTTLFNNIAPYMLVNMFVSFFTLLMITVCYESTFFKKLLVSFIIFMCGIFSELIIAFAIGLSNFNLSTKAEYDNVFIHITTNLILWSTTLVIRKFNNVKSNIKLPKIFTISLMTVPISSVILEILIFQQETFNRTMVILSLICVTSSTFITIYVYDTISRVFQERAQIEIIKREKDYYHDQSELLQSNHEELRQFRHDIKNRMITINQMLEGYNIENVLEYTGKFIERLDDTTSYSSTGNIAIDSIINYKLTKAASNGIQLSSNISIPEELMIDEDDIVVILGNLLDNAIEATNRLEENKFIHLTIEFDKNCIIIDIKNSYDSIIKIVNNQIQTRKNNDSMHGIGLKSVESVLEKYNGMLDIDYDNQVFRVTAMMYLPDSTIAN